MPFAPIFGRGLLPDQPARTQQRDGAADGVLRPGEQLADFLGADAGETGDGVKGGPGLHRHLPAAFDEPVGDGVVAQHDIADHHQVAQIALKQGIQLVVRAHAAIPRAARHAGARHHACQINPDGSILNGNGGGNGDDRSGRGCGRHLHRSGAGRSVGGADDHPQDALDPRQSGAGRCCRSARGLCAGRDRAGPDRRGVPRHHGGDQRHAGAWRRGDRDDHQRRFPRRAAHRAAPAAAALFHHAGSALAKPPV